MGLAGFAVAVVAACGVLVLAPVRRSVTDAMLFHPRRGQHQTPSDLGVAFEDLRIAGEDGVRFQAWWIPAKRTAPGVTVLFFHGNASILADDLPRYLDLQRRGIHVLAVEYRGYGESEGEPSEEALLGDGRAAFAVAVDRASRTKDRLIVGGRSLGGAVAVPTAASAPAGSLAGLWVESTFTDLRTMAGRSGIPLGSWLVAYDFDSIGVIGEVQAPILVLHGDRDELIPWSHGQALAQAARDAGREAAFVSLPGATHNGTPAAAAQIEAEAFWGFIDGLRP